MNQTPTFNVLRAAGIVGNGLDLMAEWAPVWTEQYMTLVQTAQVQTFLEPKLVALIRLNIDVTTSHLYAPGVHRHIREALKLGATRVEILDVFKLASLAGMHACSLGTPILEQAFIDSGILESFEKTAETPICDEMRALGQFNPLWETLYRWDPEYLEGFLNLANTVWKSGTLPKLWLEFLCIARDASLTQMWSNGIEQHIQAALALGATRDQILEVFKIISLQGIETCEMCIPLLNDALNKHQKSVLI